MAVADRTCLEGEPGRVQLDSRPRIGVTVTDRATAMPVGPARVATANNTYVEAVWEAGGAPILIPNLPGEAEPHILSSIDGLLLTGGGDVGPARYGEESHPHTYGVDELRDTLEDRIIHAAISSGKPLLAICRGVQMLNVSLGGSLIQHLPDVGLRDHWQAPPGSDTQHEILVEKRSRLAMIYGSEKLQVNSFHHQGLRALGAGLRAVGVAHDGLIEGVEWERDDRWVVGMQWHAELMLDGHAGHRSLFQSLVAAAASARQPRARGRDRARGGADGT